MKREHERRVALATGIARNRKSHVLLYGARIGDHSSPLSFEAAAPAMFPKYYPAESQPITLGIQNLTDNDSDPLYWQQQERHLRRLLETRVKARVDIGEIEHLSIFAVAPQPLLVLLGYLLCDLVPAVVYQLHREPESSWSWYDDEGEDFRYIVEKPDDITGVPALALGTTDPIADDRILAVVPDASIWRIRVEPPHNDFLRSESQLRLFRQAIRPLMDEIKNAHGLNAELHVFLATSVSVAVEFGRCIQPKVAPPIKLYDHRSSVGGFASTIELRSIREVPRARV